MTGLNTLIFTLDPPKELVVQGPYHYIRNPMYVAVLLVFFGEAVFFSAERRAGRK